jgi:hypothetical protein
MKFLLKNDAPRIDMGLAPGQGYLPGLPAKEVSQDEMAKIAGPLSKAMQPVEHFLHEGPVDPKDLSRGTASIPGWRPQSKRIHCIMVADDGVATELTGPELAELFKEEIAAAKAVREAAVEARKLARRALSR